VEETVAVNRIVAPAGAGLGETASTADVDATVIGGVPPPPLDVPEPVLPPQPQRKPKAITLANTREEREGEIIRNLLRR
jgi:hypothetical protein